MPARHRGDVGLRRRAGVGDDHRWRAALPVPGPRHLPRRRPRLPELLLRHRRRADRSRRDLGRARGRVRRRADRRRLRPAQRAGLRRDGAGHHVASCSGGSTTGRSTRSATPGAPQIVFFEPSILWSGLGFDTGPTPGFTDDTTSSSRRTCTPSRSRWTAPSASADRQHRAPVPLAQRVADIYGVPLWSGEYGYWGEDDDVSTA